MQEMKGIMQEVNGIDWEPFMKMHCDEDLGMVIHTPHYNSFARYFPIQFINKCIAIADSTDDFELMIAAPVMIRDVAESRPFAELLHRGIPIAAMEDLQRNAIRFLNNAVAIFESEEAAKALAAKLLHHELDSGGEWDEFIQLTKRVFYSPGSALLYLILDVLCALPTRLVARFVKILEPSIEETYAMFPNRMVPLLESGIDHTPFFVLANVCGLFTEPQWSIMMEAAVMSPFFEKVSTPSKRVSAASSLRICFDHNADFGVSNDMVSKMRGIIYCLLKFGEPSEKHAGMELYEAFARRVLNYPIPRN